VYRTCGTPRIGSFTTSPTCTFCFGGTFDGVCETGIVFWDAIKVGPVTCVGMMAGPVICVGTPSGRNGSARNTLVSAWLSNGCVKGEGLNECEGPKVVGAWSRGWMEDGCWRSIEPPCCCAWRAGLNDGGPGRNEATGAEDGADCERNASCCADERCKEDARCKAGEGPAAAEGGFCIRYASCCADERCKESARCIAGEGPVGMNADPTGTGAFLVRNASCCCPAGR